MRSRFPRRNRSVLLGRLALGLVWGLLVWGCGGARMDGLDGASPDAARMADAAPIDAAPAHDAGVRFEPDAASDAGVDAGPADAGPPPGVVLYPAGRRHSPIPPEVASALATVASSSTLEDDRLMKVGDSITVSRSFLQCFEGDVADGALASTQLRFRGSYARTSLAATVGWSSFSALEGSPNPVEQEQTATRARYATLMFGSNDAGFRDPQAFARDVWRIAELLLARGTVPLMSTIPPRDDSVEANARVPRYNLALRAIAQGLRVPLVDFHAELLPLEDHGLSGDGVHPRASGGGCVFTPEGLTAGYNVRNRITLEQLDRTVRAVSGEALDVGAVRMTGTGRSTDPYVVPSLPFAAMGDSVDGDLSIDVYGCSAADESGPARIYRVEVPEAGVLSASALSARGVDVDVHILTGLAAADCLARDDTEARATVEAGTHYVAVDTFVGATSRPGRYLVTIALEP